MDELIKESWVGSSLGEESTLHQLSPYIGKVKSTMAAHLIKTVTEPGDTILDPFAGSGTIPLQGWIEGRNVVANDLNPYAQMLLRAKLQVPESLLQVDDKLAKYDKLVSKRLRSKSLQSPPIPSYVQSFFHPDTLSEAVQWANLLREKREWFLLACLMGVLHHQRPGFLSYPSSHAVPYLRHKLFPRDDYPDLYEYRPVLPRLQSKVRRALKRVPTLDLSITREVRVSNALTLRLNRRIDAVITSPPYMGRLSYARDNRLRLWFLGVESPDSLEPLISPRATPFLDLMKGCLRLWSRTLSPGGVCVLIVGDESLGRLGGNLPDWIIHAATAPGAGFRLEYAHTEPIPVERRVRRAASGSKAETVLLFRKVINATAI